MAHSSKPSGITPERKDELDQFLSSLSAWDLRYVQKRLQNVRPNLAGLEDMPPEIIWKLVPHLDLEDIITCRLVSKAWARAWSHAAVTPFLCHRFAPGMLESRPFESPSQVFATSIRQKKTRQNARFFKKFWVPWNQAWDSGVFTNVLPTPQFLQGRGPQFVHGQYPVWYADGKVAWQPRLDLVIVDDIKKMSRQRLICSTLPVPGPNQVPARGIELMAVSNQLVVVASVPPERSHKAYVWYLQETEIRTVHLPNPAVRCYAEGESFGIVTTTGEVFICFQRGKVVALDISRIETPPKSRRVDGALPAVLFHPTDRDVAFVVLAYRYYQPLAKFDANQLLWQSSASVANPVVNAVESCVDPQSLVRMQIAPKKSDAQGSYALGIYQLTSQRTAKNIGLCKCISDVWRHGDWGTISFNVLNRTFSQHYYSSPRKNLLWDSTLDSYVSEPPSPEGVVMGAHLWDEGLLLTWRMGGPLYSGDGPQRRNLGMQILHPIGGILAPRHKHPAFSSTPQSAYPAGSEEEDLSSVNDLFEAVFQDNGKALVPTARGMWICSSSKDPVPPSVSQPPKIEGGVFEQPFKEVRPEFNVVLYLTHGDMVEMPVHEIDDLR
ncbi:hypothetical protein AK830_g3107 [Neonectria ditissima]|uniref:F-box domain-containing protein n=1 Tax=Neonectria ditissima TaxID=78410 RepID=A0A0P7BQ14_9HYPO|nr:hypothetical protein AK830_g3107 [Neonectria ditissima]